jgi:hypothetical protein
MQKIKTFTGNNEAEIWAHIASDMGGSDILFYEAQINHGAYQTNLMIDIDLGGGIEGGFEMTVFSAPLAGESDYKFAIHDKDFLDEIGKLFGMQDVELGYPEFDEKVIVKTNNNARTQKLFSSQPLRTFLNGIDSNFNVCITGSDADRKLEMTLEKGVTDVVTLRNIYSFFYELLNHIDKPA